MLQIETNVIKKLLSMAEYNNNKLRMLLTGIVNFLTHN